MGEVAVRAAKAVGYYSAGTMEFLLDQSGDFYFLEMNTRLQVEHPVTELVTGVDIVKEMMTIADGRRLRCEAGGHQAQGLGHRVPHHGRGPDQQLHALGRRDHNPAGADRPGVRVESGIYEGFEVSLYYDPMIAKLIAWGENRAEALLRMRRALNEYRIGGIKTSIPFHQQMMNSTQFMWGTFDTNFLQDRFSVTFIERPEMELSAAIAAALVAHGKSQRATVLPPVASQSGSAWKRSAGWKR
jgi:acetyl-CoA carboxylase, biotin carboxylase subunit